MEGGGNGERWEGGGCIYGEGGSTRWSRDDADKGRYQLCMMGPGKLITLNAALLLVTPHCALAAD